MDIDNIIFVKGIIDKAHWYVFDEIFNSQGQAEKYCIENRIPIDFIVKTKYYILCKNQSF